MTTHESRSASALSHAERATFARSAARWYFDFSAGVQRTYRRSVAGSALGGLPGGRLGLSIPEIMDAQKPLDKPFCGPVFCAYSN